MIIQFVRLRPWVYIALLLTGLPAVALAQTAVSRYVSPTGNDANTGQTLTTPWRTIPSYGIVATDDLVVTPELQRWMYQRAGSKVTEIKASHSTVRVPSKLTAPCATTSPRPVAARAAV